jgi:magnesium chelatase subunit D
MSAEPLTGPQYPFSAVVGMRPAKNALLCALVNPRIRTVLIKGPSGVAKTLLSRSAGALTGKKLVNVPLNVTDEQLFGCLDIETFLKNGNVHLHDGLLARADGNVIYIDDANLLDERVMSSMLDAVITGRIVIERDGISAVIPLNTVLVATMNPADSDLDPHMLDRFDVCAYVTADCDNEDKKEIVRRNIEFEDGAAHFSAAFTSEETNLRSNIERAKQILPFVAISDELLLIVTELCTKLGADGLRGDISMVNTSMALAALDGRDEVMRRDIEAAAELCLPHRRNYSPPSQQRQPEPPKNDDAREKKEDHNENKNSPPQQLPSNNNDKQDEETRTRQQHEQDISQQDMMFDIERSFRTIDFIDKGRKLKTVKNSRKGRRAITESSDMTGRYNRYRIPHDRPKDVALDATIREAISHQRDRRSDKLRVVVEDQDLREKIRERRSGCTLMFVVDASGSLGARRRMSIVKGAVLSMLRDSYVKRDHVGMMAFRRESTELILPPTRSVEYGYRKLEEIPTGGRTPLSSALQTTEAFMTTYVRSHPGERCYVVLITDGRSNVPLKEGADANEEVKMIAESIHIPGVRWIVIDAGSVHSMFDNAKEMSMALDGEYYLLEELDADRLAKMVRETIS